ncbi:AP2 domain-containing protein [Spongiibacter sp. KMU-166]|uniref:AP2 domain-containing protein n=1 Tax=Spongiibacter thalassae TaxID=2721624 RepID=A0ABX1GEA6_9GAMM|nr:AP2/ERF family transcription factor [Spongiibacter thalassae]NKI17519.1 AP2 domain-containing protein [Spongiibacter thalassae]
MPKSKAMYGISRIDDDIHRTHAWRVSLRRQRKMIVKNFPDKKFGGKRKALAAAKQFRDETIAAHPPTTRKQFCSTLRRHNKSGITGVYRYAKRYKLKDGCVKEIWYWEAHWPTAKNESEKATFSVQTYGERKAKRLAIAAREAGVARLEGVFWASERGEVS